MQIPDLIAVLRRNDLFASLSDAELAGLAKQFSPLVFRLGDPIVGTGESADGLYVIYAGKVRVIEDRPGGKPVTLAVLNKGDTFGEQSLLSGSASEFTVRAAGDVVALQLGRVEFDSFVREFPRWRAILEERVLRNNEFVFLRRLGILAHLKLSEIRDLVNCIERIPLRAGEVLFQEGETGDRAYIVRAGRIRILKDANGRPKQLAMTQPGDLVGELALLYGGQRIATAVAATDAVVLCLGREVFNRILGEGGHREVVHQLASNRLLQDQALLDAPETAEEPRRLQSDFFVERVQSARGAFARSYRVVQTRIPALAGLACLSMVDIFYGKQAISRLNDEPQIEQSQTDCLDTLSVKAEEHGYGTRLMRLSPGQLLQSNFPAIAELPEGEPAVLFAASSRSVVVASPLAGIQNIPRAEFEKRWNGRLLCLTYLPKASAETKKTGDIFKQIIPFARPYFYLVAWIGFLALVIQFLGLAGPVFSRMIIDDVLVTGDRSLFYLLLLGMLLVVGFQMAAGSLREYFTAHAMRRISASMQLRFFNHILRLPKRILSSWQVGDFVVRFDENEKLLQLVSQSGFKIILDSASIFVYMFFLLSMNPQLAAAAGAFVVSYAALMLIASPRLRAIDREIFERRKASEAHFIETITGIHTIKSLAMERHFFGRGTDLITKLKAREFKGAWLGFSIGLISALLSQAATIVVLGYGAMLALSGRLTTGELVASNALLGATLAPMMGLVSVWDELQELRISFERTSEVLRLETEEIPKRAVSPAIQGHVLFKSVSLRYPGNKTDALTDIDLEAFPGQTIAVVGRSGSGKTSLANLLVKFYAPSGGNIYLDHIDLHNVHTRSLRRQVGIVEQHPFLFSGTIRENIAKADPTAGLDRVIAAATLAGAHEFVEELPMGYETQIGERGMTLSGGQKQRLVIARAILNNPKMLILDEATAALDTESERIIQKNLERITEGKTVFVIAHRLSTVRKADLIVVLDHGRIVERGTHSELMARRGLYCYLNGASG